MSALREAAAAVGINAPLFGRVPEKIAALGSIGRRLSTGFPTFDAATRGGLPSKRVVVVGGAPGAAKTTTVAQWALEWAKEGVHVAFLAADEEAEGILVRWGQACGIALDDLEAGDQSAKDRLSLALPKSLELIDSEESDDPVTIERVSRELSKARGVDEMSVLIVDSIQMAKAAGSEMIDSPRERIDAVVRALKAAAKRDGHLVIVTSELARGAYRDAGAAINPLAAFKESGSIEYGAGTAIVLRTVDDAPGLVDVTVPKNRIGRSADAKKPFRMALDFTTATLREIDLPVSERNDAEGRDAALEDQILSVTDKRALYSKSAVYEALVSEGFGARKQLVLSKVSALISEGRLGQGSDGRIGRPLL